MSKIKKQDQSASPTFSCSCSLLLLLLCPRNLALRFPLAIQPITV
jgi:hypothetical protein